jgi:hypothetical protein
MQRDPFKWQDDVLRLIDSIDGPFHMTVKGPRLTGKTILAGNLAERYNWCYLSRVDWRTGRNTLRRAQHVAAQVRRRARGERKTVDLHVKSAITYEGLVMDEMLADASKELRDELKDCQLIEITTDDSREEIELVIKMHN